LIATDETKGSGVHAVSQPSLVSRSVEKEVSQVAVAVLGTDLCPCHAVRPVDFLDDISGLERPRETRPAGAAIELVEGREERLAGNDIDVEAWVFVVPVFVGKGRSVPSVCVTRYCSGAGFETASGLFL
jgi:hypothetical protein